MLDKKCRITFYPEYDEKIKRTKEDMILEDLICTNIMQRGVGNINPMKMSRCIIELERIKGVTKKGGDRKSKEDNPPLKTQEEFAQEIGISQKHLQSLKRLTSLIPELQDMIEDGELTATMGVKVADKDNLNVANQKELCGI
ncbi:hypothetical protein [Clostridium thermobutyricum]|uniref:ParB/Spo0J HTH domain-containing protein n=1 Tax=Clostridium thermobutyricum DSM 4928 TaxID=1121339 RepID=A0A1V4SV13_9CLOT|nr:hypothetical protein [Clostridium thermobutyricum]OPX47843.1 hypothetical protein CLTHE_14140 [Clostridium thermobutyricum DSM 4928]